MASSDSNHHSSNGEIDVEKPQGPPIEPAEEESRKITGLKMRSCLAEKLVPIHREHTDKYLCLRT
ncbi:hypothetical protein MferCBS49748_006511 [Microsporum ferrugineum]